MGKATSGQHRRWWIMGGAAVCALLMLFMQAGGATSATGAVSGPASVGLSGPHVFGGGFSGAYLYSAQDISSDGTHVWVVNPAHSVIDDGGQATGSVTELN